MSGIILRPIQSDDMTFLYRVYASTREEELAQVPWCEAQKADFLRMQFNAQHSYYMQHYSHGQFHVIELDGAPAGRLYLDRGAAEIRIVDIALLPEFRRRGIGTHLLDDILAEGARHGLPVTIHVERFNPALRLYERLGFRLAEERGVYYFLKWRPPGVPSAPDTPVDRGMNA